MNTPPIESRIQDAEFINSFMESMKIITRQTGVNFVVDTKKDGIAWMIPGKTEVYFNPIFTLTHIQAVADKLRTEHGLETNFQLNQSHLSAIVLHEINHMINHTQLKNSPMTMSIDGRTMNMLQYQQYMYQKYGSEFQRFENILEDIDVNHDATRRQAPVFEHAKQDIYRYISAPSADFSQESLAEQFARTCLRESMVDENCTIDTMVRGAIDYISNPGGLLETIRNPQLQYDKQFIAIVKLYEDYYLRLKTEEETQKGEKQDTPSDKQGEGKQQQGDDKTNPDQQGQGGEEQGEHGEGKSEGHDDQGNIQSGEYKGHNGKESQNQGDGDQQGNGNNQSNPEGKDNESGSDGNLTDLPSNQNSKAPPKPSLLPHIFDNLDPDGKPLKDENLQDSLNKTQQQLTDALAHANSEKKQAQSPSLSDQLQQAIEQAIQRKIKADNKTPEDRTLEDQIKRERGLDPEDEKNDKDIDTIKKKVKKRKETIEPKLKSLTDRNGDPVYDKIVNEIFSKIVQIRKTPTIKDRSPRRFSEGGQFDAQSLVSGIIDMKAGNTDPSIMRNEFRQEKEQRTIGAFTITLIGDGSGSMKGQKNIDQKLNFLLILSALHQLNKQLKDEGIDEELAIQTCAMMFLGSDKVKTIKKRGSDLSLKDIIEANDALDYKDGSDTNGYDAIKQYYDQISKPLLGQTTEKHAERLETIKNGKTKEILLILSDGQFNSGDNTKAKKTIAKLRDMGIIVCGIGITADGSPMIDIFGAKHEDDPEANAGGFGLICEHSADLGTTLNSLLLEHLEDLDIIGA